MIRDLQIEIQLLKNGRKSDTSSTPGSQDYGRSNKYNLREKSDRKSGGQIGHKGSSLKMVEKPDETKKHIPGYCKQCGGEFGADTVFEIHQRKQEVVIPPIKARFIEHQSYRCTCSKCNTQTTTGLPSHLKANIQYGGNIQALITYLSGYVSDSLRAQLKINTKAKQLCLAHLMRELKCFEIAFNCTWSPKLKQLFEDAISYKKQMTVEDYLGTNQKIKEFENLLTELLQIDYSAKHAKLRAFIKRLIKNRDAILTFLYYLEVPPDNNGSERAIRNAKVKMKISNQFKSVDFANHYAIIRSVIDTTIKNSKNVFDALTWLTFHILNFLQRLCCDAAIFSAT